MAFSTSIRATTPAGINRTCSTGVGIPETSVLRPGAIASATDFRSAPSSPAAAPRAGVCACKAWIEGWQAAGGSTYRQRMLESQKRNAY